MSGRTRAIGGRLGDHPDTAPGTAEPTAGRRFRLRLHDEASATVHGRVLHEEIGRAPPCAAQYIHETRRSRV